MTIRDREVIELLRDEPELLAVADAVVETQRPRRERRLAARRGVYVAAAAAAVVVVVLVPWRGGGSSDVVGRALAAVGNRPITHALLRTTGPGETIVDVRTGESRPSVTEIELWYDRQADRLRTIVRRQGQVINDVTEVAGGRGAAELGRRTQATSPGVDAGMLAFTTGYRAALADDDATVVDENATLNGQAVHWLRVRRPLATEDVAVDSQSYRPLVIRPHEPDAPPAGETRVVRFETTSDDRAFRPRRTARLDEVYGGEARPLHALRPAGAATALAAPVVWAGPRLGGLPLRSMELERLTRLTIRPGADAGEGRGVSIVYGDVTARGAVDRDGRYLRIREATRPEPAYGLLSGGLTIEPVPDAGALGLSFRPRSGRPGRGTWIARLRHGRLWLVVDSSSRDLVVAAAQALRPVR